MAFFKFRKGGDEHPTPAPAPQSVEAMRKRARHRLIGAAVLVLVGVVGFPLLFDNQPRPVAVDIPIVIPDKAKAKAKPLTLPQEAASSVVVAPVAAAALTSASTPAAARAVAAERGTVGMITESKLPEKIVEKAAEKAVEKPASKPEAKSEAKPAPVVEAKPAVKKDDGAKARALLDGASSDKPADKPAAAGSARYVVQVGAFADVLKAREARQKLEKAGLKTYTQVVQSPERRIRVRVGPFESKSEADSVAAKIKKLDLPAAILEL